MRPRLAVATILVWSTLAVAGGAHEFEAPADRSGYSVPSINHGAMAAIARHRDRILALAGAAAGDAELADRLLHNRTQMANCLWLAVPGSLSDEASPFNLCAHAETAGLKGILERLRTIPDTRDAAERLVSDLDREMVLEGTSYALCEYSGEDFNTASQVRPDWIAAAGYVVGNFLAEVLTILGFLFLAPIGLRALFRSRRSHASGPGPAGGAGPGGEDGVRSR